ncbi:MAG TPA: Ig-like domain-containing protein [Chryseosolibacter sp.]|nr:Ig-like domain-containing protein [Chryseosolibacter sp.]
MRQNLNLLKSMLSLPLLSFFMGMVILSGCDMLQEDKSAQQPELEFVSDPLVITPAGSGIIDLRSLIASSGNYSFQISQRPTLGTLQSMGGDVLRYTANEGVNEGQDAFIVSVFSSANSLLGQDSVSIVITQDSTNMPCGVYAINDYAYYSDSTAVDGHIDIDVLLNDILCGVEPSQIEVSIPEDLMEGSNPLPQAHFGTVSVLADNRIRYTPDDMFNGTDSIIYKLVKPAGVPEAGDPEITAYGFIFISAQKSNPPDSSCKDSFYLNDDFYVIRLNDQDSTAGDSTNVRKIFIGLFDNDFLCPAYTFEFTDPENGGIISEWNYAGQMYYEAPPLAVTGFADSFSYEVCIEGVCREASVTITCE